MADGAIAGKPAPTFDPRCHQQRRSLWEPGLPAIGPVQALEIYQKSTFATSANRLAKCTVIPSFK